jgi:uncharacterized protein YigE (DUF2233 family)
MNSLPKLPSSSSPEQGAAAHLLRALTRAFLVLLILLCAAAPAAACESRLFEGSRFTVCRFDSRTQALRLVAEPEVRSFAALARRLGPDAVRLRFAMNAGMFDEAGAPIGLFVADGAERHAVSLKAGWGNFHLLPNGIFSVASDGRVAVTESRRFAARRPAVRWATQSGPMLVIEGKLHPKFDADGESQLIRNGVGVSDPHTAWFAISDDPVSFGRFARLFRDALHCSNALYLDGSVSSLWDRASGRHDESTRLGPMVAVLGR